MESKIDTPVSNLFENSCAKRVKTVLSKVFFWDAWRLYVRSFYNHPTSYSTISSLTYGHSLLLESTKCGCDEKELLLIFLNCLTVTPNFKRKQWCLR